MVEPGMLIGTPQQVIDRVEEYRGAGAEWIIVALRAPFDWESYELFIDRVLPAFR
jgi:alkanesulfonate monooxygenase SsuD/methylene tetrahydromethanopterin reductase-like flavin-dependent oxidoreductase (luciferase family)